MHTRTHTYTHTRESCVHVRTRGFPWEACAGKNFRDNSVKSVSLPRSVIAKKQQK